MPCEVVHIKYKLRSKGGLINGTRDPRMRDFMDIIIYFDQIYGPNRMIGPKLEVTIRLSVLLGFTAFMIREHHD